MIKRFRLRAEDIKPLAEGFGAALATDRIMVDGLPVGFMYRQKPDNPADSGWRFFSGDEDQDYADDPDKAGAYDLNTIANYDPSIIPLLISPVGSVYEKAPGAAKFERVTDRDLPDDAY
jgi:hypothetical protein